MLHKNGRDILEEERFVIQYSLRSATVDLINDNKKKGAYVCTCSSDFLINFLLNILHLLLYAFSVDKK